MTKYQDVVASISLLLFSIVLFSATFHIQQLTVSEIGADFVPRLVSIGIFILSLILLIQTLKKPEANEGHKVNDYHQETTPVGEKADEDTTSDTQGSPWSVVPTLVLLLGYVYLLPYVGFLIMTTVYLFLQMLVMAEKTQRRLPLFLMTSIIASVSIYYCFKSVFHLRLPSGILG
ncbi:tripartite tricarboxylate transporter TctB family protein [Caldalkalibacillus salinus]|uniref:tripartite tricarboxylate transporter TctB family protein n=1 Tax=Caldalkalibacillus salinus TaxID=2803787 RepID=UPI00192295D6